MDGGAGGRCIRIGEWGEVKNRETGHGSASAFLNEIQVHYVHEEEIQDLQGGEVELCACVFHLGF